MRTRSLYNKGSQKAVQWNLVWFDSCGVQFPDKFQFYLDNVKLGNSDVVVADCIEQMKSAGGYTPNGTTLNIKYIEDTKGNLTNSVITYDYSGVTFASNDEVKTFKIFVESSYKPEPEASDKKTKVVCYTKELKNDDKSKTLTIPFKEFCVAKRFAIDDRHPEENEIAIQNYSNYQKGVACNLIQKLSIIKNELWWNINWGLPLLEKVRNKSIIDSVIINIVLSTRDVRNIVKLTSSVDKRTKTYSFDMVVETVWNEQINLSNVLSLL